MMKIAFDSLIETPFLRNDFEKPLKVKFKFDSQVFLSYFLDF